MDSELEGKGGTRGKPGGKGIKRGGKGKKGGLGEGREGRGLITQVKNEGEGLGKGALY